MFTKEENAVIRTLANGKAISVATVKRRMKEGMTLEEALTKPSKPRSRVYCVRGVTGTIRILAKKFKVNYSTVINRMDAGFTLEDALTMEKRKPGRKIVAKAVSEEKKQDQKSLARINEEKCLKAKGKTVFVRTGACGGYYTFQEDKA